MTPPLTLPSSWKVLPTPACWQACDSSPGAPSPRPHSSVVFRDPPGSPPGSLLRAPNGCALVGPVTWCRGSWLTVRPPEVPGRLLWGQDTWPSSLPASPRSGTGPADGREGEQARSKAAGVRTNAFPELASPGKAEAGCHQFIFRQFSPSRSILGN